jgi:vacuolar-type H+-ATPase subunit I/STV1
MAGLFSIILAIAAWKLAVSSEVDLAPDAAKIVPYLVVFCFVYGFLCLAYAYCRFFLCTETAGHHFKIPVLNRYRWFLYILALVSHGLSLVWVIPVLIGMTDLRLVVSIPLGFLGIANIFSDAAPYLKKLGIWIKEALFTRKKSAKSKL